MVHLERLHAAGASAVARVDGPPELLAGASRGLPDGAARAEAMAARLEHDGVAIAERERRVAVGELLAHCRARGGSSVELVRAAPGIETRLEIGTWFDAGPITCCARQESGNTCCSGSGRRCRIWMR